MTPLRHSIQREFNSLARGATPAEISDSEPFLDVKEICRDALNVSRDEHTRAAV